MAVAAVVALVAAATLAYFSDTETSGGITFTTSTDSPDLQVVSPYQGQPYPGFPPESTYNGENIPGVMLEDMKPGDPPIVWRMHVNNVGTENGVLYIHFNVTANDENVLWEPEADVGDSESPNAGVPGDPHNGELGEYLLVDVYYGDEKYWSEWEAGNYTNFKHVADTINAMHCQEFELGVLNAEFVHENGKDVIIVFTLPGPTTLPDAMSDIVECDIALILKGTGTP
ncbi:hypothetical protein ES703_120159 [subsurface metagenome]